MYFWEWLKHNEHLSGWVQAVGVIASLLVAIAVAAMQQKKAHRQAGIHHQQTLDLISRQQHKDIISILLALESIANQALLVFQHLQQHLEQPQVAYQSFDHSTLDLLSDAMSHLPLHSLAHSQALRQALHFKIAYKRCITRAEKLWLLSSSPHPPLPEPLDELNQQFKQALEQLSQSRSDLSRYVLQLIDEQSHPRSITPR